MVYFILSYLGGALTILATVASLGAVAGVWAVETNEYGRMTAILLLAVLIAPRIAERFTRPLVALGSRLSNAAANKPCQRAASDGDVRSPVVPRCCSVAACSR